MKEPSKLKNFTLCLSSGKSKTPTPSPNYTLISGAFLHKKQTDQKASFISHTKFCWPFHKVWSFYSYFFWRLPFSTPNPISNSELNIVTAYCMCAFLWPFYNLEIYFANLSSFLPTSQNVLTSPMFGSEIAPRGWMVNPPMLSRMEAVAWDNWIFMGWPELSISEATWKYT